MLILFQISNCPISNCPISNCPISNCPISNCPISNYPISNYPISNYPKWHALRDKCRTIFDEIAELTPLAKSLQNILEPKADLCLRGHYTNLAKT